MKLSVVIPCYNEEQNVAPLYAACNEAFREHIDTYELIFVNDGSRDGTWPAIRALCEQGDCAVKAVCLSRNFGKEAAMYAGLRQATGDYVTLLDADLQQSPDLVREMVDFLDNNPDFDSVAAYQENRQEGRFTAWCKKRFYRLMDRICDIDLHEGASDFRTFRRTVAGALLDVTRATAFPRGFFPGWVFAPILSPIPRRRGRAEPALGPFGN